MTPYDLLKRSLDLAQSSGVSPTDVAGLACYGVVHSAVDSFDIPTSAMAASSLVSWLCLVHAVEQDASCIVFMPWHLELASEGAISLLDVVESIDASQTELVRVDFLLRRPEYLFRRVASYAQHWADVPGVDQQVVRACLQDDPGSGFSSASSYANSRSHRRQVPPEIVDIWLTPLRRAGRRWYAEHKSRNPKAAPFDEQAPRTSQWQVAHTVRQANTSAEPTEPWRPTRTASGQDS